MNTPPTTARPIRTREVVGKKTVVPVGAMSTGPPDQAPRAVPKLHAAGEDGRVVVVPPLSVVRAVAGDRGQKVPVAGRAAVAEAAGAVAVVLAGESGASWRKNHEAAI